MAGINTYLTHFLLHFSRQTMIADNLYICSGGPASTRSQNINMFQFRIMGEKRKLTLNYIVIGRKQTNYVDQRQTSKNVLSPLKLFY